MGYHLRDRTKATVVQGADVAPAGKPSRIPVPVPPSTARRSQDNETSPSAGQGDHDGPSEPREVSEEATTPSAKDGIENHKDTVGGAIKSPARKARSLNDLRREASMSPEQLNAIELAQSQLTRSQRDLIHKRREVEGRARRESVSSRGEGPSQPKGKGADPKNWGALDLSDTELEAQQAMYDSIAANKQVRLKEPSEYESTSDETTESARRARNRAQRVKYREKRKRLAKAPKKDPETPEPDEQVSASAGGRVKKNKRRASPSRKRKASKKAKKSMLKPTAQLEKLSYINNAFKRTDALDKQGQRRRARHNPSDSSSTDTESDNTDSDNEPSDRDSTTDSSRDSSDPSSDSSSEEDSSSDDGRSKRKRSKTSGSWKPIPPENYDGRPSIAVFHRFMTSASMYLEDANIPRRRRVYRISTFLKGSAYTYYAREVSPNVEKWTVSRFFRGLFDACFPVDFKEKQRERLENLTQGKHELREYISLLNELFLVTGVRRSREKARYLWRGLRQETKERLRYDGISPESSSYDRIIKKAEHAELAYKLRQATRRDETSRSAEYQKSQSNKGKSRLGSDNYQGRRTNGQGTSSNSNQSKFKKHFDKKEQNRRDYKEKSNTTDRSHQRANISAEDKARYKAEGRCYECGDKNHMARNCPKNNSVSDKGRKNPSIDNYNVAFDSGKTAEALRDLADTTEATHNIEVAMMDWEENDFTVTADDELSFEDVTQRPSWADEVEEMFREFDTENSVDEVEAYLMSGSTDSWPSLKEWTEPAAPFVKEDERTIGDPILERIEYSLLQGAPYLQDMRRGALSRDRFFVARLGDEYMIKDAMYYQHCDQYLKWSLAQKPEFNITGWYQKRLNEAFGLPAGRHNRLPGSSPLKMDNCLGEAIEDQLALGAPYVGETYWEYKNLSRFTAQYVAYRDEYQIHDMNLKFITRLPAELLADSSFSVSAWYNKRLLRSYEDLWENIFMTFEIDRYLAQVSSEPDDGYDFSNVRLLMRNLEWESENPTTSTWIKEEGCNIITHLDDLAETTGFYPAVQVAPNDQNGVALMVTQTVLQADRYKELERNSAKRKDLARHVPEPVTIVAQIEGRPVRALLDSGSLGDFMSSSLADQLQVRKMELTRPLNIQLAVQGSKTKANYGAKVLFEYQKVRSNRYFDIINLQNYDLILGTPFMHQHRVAVGLNPPRVIIGSNEPLPIQGKGVKILESQAMSTYQDNLDRARQAVRAYAEPICRKAMDSALPPLRKINHRIPIIDPAKRYKWRPSRCPEPLRLQWIEKRNSYVQSGRWMPSTSFNTVPMLCIPKPGKPGEPPRLRTVIDLRERNANTHKLTCPLPDMEGILRRVSQARYRSTMDGTDAYEQIRIEPSDVKFSAMATPEGPMLSQVMQQGDCNAVATFQTIMVSLFSPWIGKWIDIYLDDIVIYSDSIDEHVKHCKLVIDILRREQFFLNKDKIHILCEEMKLLGRVIDNKGIRMDPDKVDALTKWKTPTNRELLRGFLGAASYLAEDIDRVRVPMGILFNLTSDKVPFRWDFTHQRAFEQIKTLAMRCKDHHRVPLRYDRDAPTINVVTDACATGIAGVVSQGEDWKTADVAAFFSAKLNKAQQNYPVHELEMLAGVETMLRHRDILQGARFKWYTDHKGLIYLLNQRDLSGRQARWMEKIQGFDFEVIYVPGAENILSDALSRLYAYDAPGTVRASTEYTEHDILQNTSLQNHAITTPLYVGQEGAFMVMPPENDFSEVELGATTRAQRRQEMGLEVSKPPPRAAKNKPSERKTPGSEVQGRQRVVITKLPPITPLEPSKVRIPRLNLGAETGRPETGKEFAARMRNHFKVLGPRIDTDLSAQVTEQAPVNVASEGVPPQGNRPENPPSLIDVVTDGNGIDLIEIVRSRYKEDQFFRLILDKPKDYRNFEVENGLIFQRGDNRRVLCIPLAYYNGRSLREIVIHEAHSVLAHLSARKTIAYLRDQVWWKDLISDVTKYCESCMTCKRSKSSNYKPHGLLHTLDVPEHPWESVGIDFVGPLPESSDRNGTYDCITVIIDRLTGMVHLVPSREDYTAREVAELVFAEVYKHHGLPKTIVSDRDKWFTATFWDHLHKLIGTKLRMSSAYHPESDGSTERANRTMIQMIRQCIHPKQRDWVSKLPAIEFALNSARSESTGYAPFFLNTGRMPRSFIWNHPAKDEYPGVRAFATKIRNAIMAAHDSVLDARVKQTRSANRKRQLTPFVTGDLVYLSTENLRFPKGLARKFLPRYIGPFKIIRDFGNNSFRVDLPSRMKSRGVHDVFHASKLRVHIPNDDRLFPGRSDDQVWEYDGDGVEPEFTVDKILSHSGAKSSALFELLWRDGDRTWLPYHKISHLTVLQDYLDAMGVTKISDLQMGPVGENTSRTELDAQVELGYVGYDFQKRQVPGQENIYKTGRGRVNYRQSSKPPSQSSKIPSYSCSHVCYFHKAASVHLAASHYRPMERGSRSLHRRYPSPPRSPRLHHRRVYPQRSDRLPQDRRGDSRQPPRSPRHHHAPRSLREWPQRGQSLYREDVPSRRSRHDGRASARGQQPDLRSRSPQHWRSSRHASSSQAGQKAPPPGQYSPGRQERQGDRRSSFQGRQGVRFADGEGRVVYPGEGARDEEVLRSEAPRGDEDASPSRSCLKASGPELERPLESHSCHPSCAGAGGFCQLSTYRFCTEHGLGTSWIGPPDSPAGSPESNRLPPDESNPLGYQCVYRLRLSYRDQPCGSGSA